MKYWTEYEGHEANYYKVKKELYDDNIYTFDIETTSFLVDSRDGNIYSTNKYLWLKDNEKNYEDFLDFGSNMYIWQFGINEDVYFGRTWKELRAFLNKIYMSVPEMKYLFIHNASYEFQFLRKEFNFEKIFSRKKRKIMKAVLSDFNFEIRCTYTMTNLSLNNMAKVYNLPVKKMIGDLDYNKLRHSKTRLTKKELEYCEYDCLVIYYYIKLELAKYKHVRRIPITSTGHVRRELQELVYSKKYYVSTVRKAINTDPYIFNLLTLAFMGGYTHANYFFTDEVLKNITSFDFTSSYPYVMVTCKFPSTKFRKCFINNIEDLNPNFAYLLKIKMYNGKSKYLNTFLSASKCIYIRNPSYDNGRLIDFDECEIVVTDIDAIDLIESYSKDSDFKYEIEESYYSRYNYLPKTLINFILDKYEDKTKYKGMEGKEIEYALAKSLFNAIFGMTVTNTIRDEVIYDYSDLEWRDDRKLTNEEIIEKLLADEKKGFLSFAYGVWVTAHARHNLISNIKKLDKYCVYSDTDSVKLLPGFNKQIIIDYNNSVKIKIKKASLDLNIPYDRYQPADVNGKKHLLGLFDPDGEYLEFITQGAKKYVVKVKDKEGKEKIKITVAGVPKVGAKDLTDLTEFKDGFTFKYETTNKKVITYIDNQKPIRLTDYTGKTMTIKDKTGICMLPTTYVLGKDDQYSMVIYSSERSVFKL